MAFRRRALSNVPWLRRVSDTVIKHILEEMEITRIRPGGIILKRGDKANKMFVVLEGEVEIYVVIDWKTDEKVLFDTLNTGSCFCVFQFLNPDSVQMMTFKAKGNCSVATITRDQIHTLENRFYQL